MIVQSMNGSATISQLQRCDSLHLPVNNYRPASRSNEENKHEDGADNIAFVKCQIRSGVDRATSRVKPRDSHRDMQPDSQPIFPIYG